MSDEQQVTTNNPTTDRDNLITFLDNSHIDLTPEKKQAIINVFVDRKITNESMIDIIDFISKFTNTEKVEYSDNPAVNSVTIVKMCILFLFKFLIKTSSLSEEDKLGWYDINSEVISALCDTLYEKIAKRKPENQIEDDKIDV